LGRIRTIKPDFWKDEDINTLAEATQLLAIALLNYADDEGYFNANEMLIKAECCPLREPSVKIHVSLTELSRMGYVRLGEFEQKRYGHIVNFEKHQRVSHKKDSDIKNLEIVWEDSVKTCGRRAEDVRNEEGSVSEDVPLNRIELKGIEENINTNPTSKEVPSKKESPVTKLSSPPKEKNGVSTNKKIISDIKNNFKSYDQKIKIVLDYCNSLEPEEKQKFYSGALSKKSFGTPTPPKGSEAMHRLLINWYDQTVENKSPQNQNARQAEM